MSTFALQILAPDGVLYDGPCESLVAPGCDGQFGILAQHHNMIAGIVPGRLSYTVPGEKKKHLAVSYGFMKVTAEAVLVMVDAAERPENIDAARAQRKADEAMEEMLQNKSLRDYKMAEANRAKAMNRLRIRHGYDAKEFD